MFCVRYWLRPKKRLSIEHDYVYASSVRDVDCCGYESSAVINCKCDEKVRRNDTVCVTGMAAFVENIHKFRR